MDPKDREVHLQSSATRWYSSPAADYEQRIASTRTEQAMFGLVDSSYQYHAGLEPTGNEMFKLYELN